MNRERLTSRMKQEGVDALIASTPENVAYLTNLWMMIQVVARRVDSYALISTSQEKPSLIASLYGLISGVDLLEPERLNILPHSDHNMYGDTAATKTDEKIKGFMAMKARANDAEALIEAIKEQNLDSAVIGIENLMPIQMLERLKKEFPKMRMTNVASGIFHWARLVKSPDEIARLRKAAAVMEKAVDLTLANVTEGMSEIAAANILKSAVIKEDTHPVAQVLDFGTNASHKDAPPTTTRLKKGDVIHFDVVCNYEHYFADTARTVVFGQEPTDKQKKYWASIVEAQKVGIEMAKPGVKASEIFNAMLKTVQKGMPHVDRLFFGHSIGLEVWEPPIFSDVDHTVLEENMVINLEVPYSELGLGGLQVEDTMVITRSGNELLTVIDTNLKL
jgi:Xaa-Pro aminopeptidase